MFMPRNEQQFCEDSRRAATFFLEAQVDEPHGGARLRRARFKNASGRAGGTLASPPHHIQKNSANYFPFPGVGLPGSSIRGFLRSTQQKATVSSNERMASELFSWPSLFSSPDEKAMWRVRTDDDPHAFAELVGRWHGPIR